MRATVVVLALALGGCSPGASPQPPSPLPPSPAPSRSAPAPVVTPPPIMDYPATRTVPQSDVLHGVEVRDPYRWLEDEKSPQVRDWMAQQDALARRELGKLGERDAIVARLKQLMYLDSVSAPEHRKGRYFFTRRHADREKAIVYWKQGKKGSEKVLLDPNSWSPDGSVSLQGWWPSWNGKLVAFKRSENNSDEATLYVLEVDTGKTRAVDTIVGAKYADASWAPDDRGFYYTWLPVDPSIPVAERPGYAEVRYHALGTDPQGDAVLHAKTGDASKFLSAIVSRDGRWLLLNVHFGWTASDAYVMDLRAPAASRRWQPIATGGKAHYYPFAYAGRIYLHADEGAPRGRVFRVDPSKLERAAWQEVVAERPDATLSEVRVLGGKLTLNYLRNAASWLEIRDLDGKGSREVALPTVGSVSGPIGLDDEDEAYFTFESFTVAPEVHALSLKTGATSLYARVSVPIDPSAFTVEQVFYPSKDGTRISMFLVLPKSFARDGQGRILLTGYGGFQSSETPVFRASIYPWIERGGGFALPNLRGGGEYGEQWHQAGMLERKQNVFDDFVAAAEYLTAERYTRPERLAIRGASNGGLLVGAAVTQRPDLFGVALCGVPLLDMVRYHRFGSGKTWTSEYGSADDPAQFRALLAYSPYHHVVAGTRYPPLLVLSADSDDRVDPMHARKFAAAMQAASRGGEVLLRIEHKAGHTGADMVKALVDKTADEYAFALHKTARP